MARQAMINNSRYIETAKKSQSASLKAAWKTARRIQTRKAIIENHWNS